MEIIILFAILSILIRLAELHLQADKSFKGAVKLAVRHSYLLNTVISPIDQKTTQTTLIQTQNLKFEG